MPEPAAALFDATGVRAHSEAIGHFLRKLGYSYKKKTLAAAERRRTKVKKQREDWLKHRIPATYHFRKKPESRTAA